jgi:hypothetical protein
VRDVARRERNPRQLALEVVHHDGLVLKEHRAAAVLEDRVGERVALFALDLDLVVEVVAFVLRFPEAARDVEQILERPSGITVLPPTFMRSSGISVRWCSDAVDASSCWNAERTADSCATLCIANVSREAK